MKRYRVFDFESNTEKVYTEDVVRIISNYIERADASPELVNKLAHVVEALTAASNVLEDISHHDIDNGSRLAGLFAGQAIQLRQQIDTLQNMIQ